jgi:hypothetical protein
MQLPSQASVPYATLAFWFHLTSLPECLSFLGSLYNTVLAWLLMTMSLAQCRNGMAGQPSLGSRKFLPGPIITLGPFLQVWVVPYD